MRLCIVWKLCYVFLVKSSSSEISERKALKSMFGWRTKMIASPNENIGTVYIHNMQYKQTTTIEWSFPIWVIYCVCAQCIHIQCERQSYIVIFAKIWKNMVRILEFKIFLKSRFILPFILLLSLSLSCLCYHLLGNKHYINLK